MLVEKLSKGFSLVELLVVLLLMGLTLSIVVPSVNKIYNQHLGEQELQALRSYIKEASIYAFHKNQALEIELQSNQLRVFVESPERGQLSLPNDTDTYQATKLTLGLDSDDELEPSHSIFNRQFDHLNFQFMSFIASETGVLSENSIAVAVGNANSVRTVEVTGVLNVTGD